MLQPVIFVLKVLLLWAVLLQVVEARTSCSYLVERLYTDSTMSKDRIEKYIDRVFEGCNNQELSSNLILLGDIAKKGLLGNESQVKALNLFEYEAKNDNIYAITVLTETYLYSLWTKEDLDISLSYAKKGATLGDGYLVYLKALIQIRMGLDESQVIKTLKEAAEYEVPEAEFLLGTYYLEGKVVPKDTEKAREFFKKSASKGYPLAQFNLAILSTEKTSEYEYWLRLASLSGLENAQLLLATELIEGKRIKRNILEGVQWLKKAIEENGSVIAAYQYADMILAGDVKNESYEQAIKYLIWAYHKGFKEAANPIVQYFMNKYCISRNETDIGLARIWFSRLPSSNHTFEVLKSQYCN